MSKIINSVVVIALLSAITITACVVSINGIIDNIHYNNAETISVRQIEKGTKINKRYIRVTNAMAYYFYALKTYNYITGPDNPAAVYFPVISPEKVKYRSSFKPTVPFKVLVKDKNYDKAIIKNKEEATLEIIDFKARVIKKIPESVRKELKSEDYKEVFVENPLYLEKDAKPIPIWLIIILCLLVLGGIALIVIIVKRGGIEIIKVTRTNVKVKKVTDNIGDDLK
jgi:hypothetical protein